MTKQRDKAERVRCCNIRTTFCRVIENVIEHSAPPPSALACSEEIERPKDIIGKEKMNRAATKEKTKERHKRKHPSLSAPPYLYRGEKKRAKRQWVELKRSAPAPIPPFPLLILAHASPILTRLLFPLCRETEALHKLSSLSVLHSSFYVSFPTSLSVGSKTKSLALSSRGLLGRLPRLGAAPRPRSSPQLLP